MELLRHFSKISRRDVGIAGGKGASLGEMTKAGIPVPPGFVVLAPAFDRFLQETELDEDIEAILHRFKHTDINSVERASNEIRDLIADAEFPSDLARLILAAFVKLRCPYVAVRSSATAEDSSVASWAGELETYLNTTQATLLEKVKECWASLFTPRAIFYRYEKKLHRTTVSVAVVVQAMVQSEVSGIAFTVHPVTKDYGQMVIEAGFGLGEAIVGGKITPDTYIMHKSPLRILEKHLGEQEMMMVRGKGGTVEQSLSPAKRGQQKLTDAKLLTLAKLCQNIEQHYGKPQDIEWALVGSKFYVLQSRPITTL